MAITAQTGFRERVLDVLVRWGDLTPRDRKRVEADAHASGSLPDRLLIERGMVQRPRLLEALAEVAGVPPFDVSCQKIKYGDAQLIPREVAEKRRLLVVGRNDGRLVVGMADPDDAFAMQQVAMLTGLETEARIVWDGDLDAATERAYSVKVERITAETPHHAPSPAPRNGGAVRFVAASHAPAPDLKSSYSTVRNTPPLRTLTLGTVSPQARPGPAPSSGPASLLRDVCTTTHGESRLRRLVEAARKLCGAEHAALWRVSANGQHLELAERLGPGVASDRPLLVPMDEHTLPGYTFVSRREFCSHSVQQDPRHSRELDARMDWTPRSAACCPVVWDGQPLGVLQVVNRVEGPFDDSHVDMLRSLAEQAGLVLTAEGALGTLRAVVPGVVEALRLQSTDRNHGELVARVAVAMGQELRLGSGEIELLRIAGYLHDLGRLQGDPGHAERGAEVLEQTGVLAAVAPAVRHHHDAHERDGESIPLLARILAVAEGWVELLEELGARGRAEALRRMSADFGRRYHPALRIPFDIAAANVTPPEG